MSLRAEAGTVWPSKRADKKLTTKGWKLHKGDGERTFVQHINFARAFPEAPAVFVALSAIDLLSESDFRVNVSAAAVTDTSMDIRFQTHRSSKVWSASASFFAYDRRAASADPDGEGRSARIESGTYAFARHLAGWELSAGGGERRYSVRIPFARPFPAGRAPPRVIACIAGLEVSKEDDLRIRLIVEDVTNEAFRLTALTWKRSSVNSLTVSWLAAEATLAEFPSGCSLRMGSSQFRSSDAGFTLHTGEGDREVTQRVDFARPLFERRPRAIVCLNSLDINCEMDNRVKAIETGISPEGFGLTLGTWSDTVIWGATASWLAFLEGDVYRKPARPPSPAGEPEAKRKKVEEGAPAAAAAAPAAAAPAPAKDEAAAECKICYDAKINTCILPCGHMCVCFECSKLLKPPAAKCPICRSKIDRIIKTFLI